MPANTTHVCPRCERPVQDTAVLCPVCGDDVRRLLIGIQGFVMLLPAKMARFGTNFSTSGYSPRLAETPLPFDQRASVLSRRVVALSRELGEAIGAKDSALAQASTPQGLARLRRHESALDLAHAIERLHDDLTRYLDPPPRKRYLGPCDMGPNPTCEADIYVEEGEPGRPLSDHVVCPACLRSITVNERRAELIAKAMDHIGTVAEILRLLKVYGADRNISGDVIRGLVRHGRLVPVGRVVSPSPQGMRRVNAYRVGDVLKALAQTRRTPRKSAS